MLQSDMATFDHYKRMRQTSLEELATVHPDIADSSALFEKLKLFDGAHWAFRGQGEGWPLKAAIERCARRPGVAEDFVMREFRRRFHHYSARAPRRDDDLEWLALMQHHGAPTRLLDWTRSAEIAAFFAAESPTSAKPFVVWAANTDRINAEAKKMLGFSEVDDISATEIFRSVFWSQPKEGLYLVAAVEPLIDSTSD